MPSTQPIHKAAKNGDLQELRQLIAGRADIEARDGHGFTPLIVAASNGRQPAVVELLAAGAAVEAATEIGDTALILAGYWGKREAAEALLAAGADACMINKDGTAADRAKKQGHAELEKLLRQAEQEGEEGRQRRLKEGNYVEYRDTDGDIVKFRLEDGKLIKYVNGNRRCGARDASGVVTSLRYKAGTHRVDDQHGWGGVPADVRDVSTRILQPLALLAHQAGVSHNLPTQAEQEGEEGRQRRLKEAQAKAAVNQVSEPGSKESEEHARLRQQLKAMEARTAELEKRNRQLEEQLEAAKKGEKGATAAGSGAAAAVAKSISSGDAEGKAIKLLSSLQLLIQDLGGPSDALSSADSMRAWLSRQGVAKEVKFSARKLVFGDAADSIGDIGQLTCVSEEDVYQMYMENGKDWLKLMDHEINEHGSTEDKANWKYITTGQACIDIPDHVRKQIEKGSYHGGELRPDDYDFNHRGMALQDFVDHNDSKLAGLKDHHVAALRLYTSSSYPLINNPLRAQKGKHPLPVVVFTLDKGLELMKKVRAKVNPEGFATFMDLYRGMAGVAFEDSFDLLKTKPGTARRTKLWR